MALIEIPLNSYRYHFRRLTWQEEARLKFPKGIDQRKVMLSTAMVDVSGMPVTTAQAMQIFEQLPEALLWRVWILYSGLQPLERYYTSGGLYEAPDPMIHRRHMQDEEEHVGAVADAVTAKLEAQFGRAEVNEAEQVSRRMFQNAKSAGTLVRASGEGIHG